MSNRDPDLIGTYETDDGRTRRSLTLNADGAFIWWLDVIPETCVNQSGTWTSPTPDRVVLNITHDSSKAKPLPRDEACEVDRPAKGHATALVREFRLPWTDDVEDEYMGVEHGTYFRLTVMRDRFRYREESGGFQGHDWSQLEGSWRRDGSDAIDFSLRRASSETEVGDHDRTSSDRPASGQVRAALLRGKGGRVCAIVYDGRRLERQTRP